MTQAVQAAPARPPASGQAAPAVPGAPAPAPAAHAEDTPRLLNRLQVIAVAACLLFAVVSALVQVFAHQANGRAADNTEQVVRVQQIQSSLLRADALATNAFLSGGAETARYVQYDQEIDNVLRLVADAAEAQPADRAVLADLNVAVRDYTTSVAQARDYNRQNLVIGIAYLNGASTTLRSDALPIVQALVDANSSRATDELDGEHPVWLLVLGLLALAALIGVNHLIAQRFHRRVNVGLAVAATVVVVLTLLTAVLASSRNSDNEATRDGSFRTAFNEASARTAANDSKARESQGLINRGSGSVYEVQWKAAADTVVAAASPETLRLWKSYVAQHDAVRAADDSGQWNDAVALATSGDEDGPTALLDRVDASAAATVSDNAEQATSSFRSGGIVALFLVGLTILGGLVAAAACASGINQRRREYS